jgi:hypothetical protein
VAIEEVRAEMQQPKPQSQSLIRAKVAHVCNVSAKDSVNRINLKAKPIGARREGVREKIYAETKSFERICRGTNLEKVNGCSNVYLHLRSADFLSQPDTRLLMMSRQRGNSKRTRKKCESLFVLSKRVADKSENNNKQADLHSRSEKFSG